jgi:TRAP transporter TAXI family solute receptor
VLANSDIQTVADLRGRRVGLGPAGGTGIELSVYVFDAAGFGIAGLRASYTAYDEALTALGDGNLDAVVVQTALPNPAIRQLESTGRKVRLISIPDDIRSAINAEHPYFGLMDVPAEMYDTDASAATLYGANMVIVDADLDEEVVYLITKTLFENVDVIRNSHPAAVDVSVETSADVPIPLHPGAERYFREVGVLPEGE